MMVIELVEGDESRIRWNYGEGWHYADVYDLIRAYESVRHGHWIEEIGMFLCSECGDSWGTETEEMVRSFNFCPNCGAMMDEVEEDADK